MATNLRMNEWVGQRHNIQDQTPAELHGQRPKKYEDVYVPVPNPVGKSQKKRRVKTEEQDVGDRGDAQASGAATEGQRPFHGTDASSIDRTVTSPEAQKVDYVEEQDAARYNNRNQFAHSPENEELTDYDELDESDGVGGRGEGDSEPPDYQGQGEAPNDFHAQGAREDGVSRSKPNGHSLPPVRGDSYPPTTSGNPSTVGTDERGDPQPGLNVYAQPQQSSLTMRGPGGNRMNGVVAGGVLSRPKQPAANIWENQHASNAADMPSDPVDASNLPAAHPAHTRRSLTEPHHNQHSKHGTTKDTTRGTSKATPQREQPIAQPHQHQAPEHVTERSEMANQALQRISQDQSQQRKTKPRKKSATAVTTQQDHHTAPPQEVNRPPLPPQAQRQPTPERRPITSQDQQDLRVARETQDGRSRAESDPPVVLDYTDEELLKMTYKELKEASFDGDPEIKPFELVPGDETLENKLAAIAGMHHKVQQHFFATLTIDEWEDAGDWFLQRFGETAKKFKDVRREKRKVAQAFEDEIEERQRQVSKKHEGTQNALNAMKQSGNQVLDSTPKKTKKKN